MNCKIDQKDMLKDYLDELINLRRSIHEYPEVAGKETQTVETLINYIARYDPDEIIHSIAGKGFAAVFKGKIPGPTVMFSCELDALPIEEVGDMIYKSKHDGVSHKCGHDGHMASVASLSPLLARYPLKSGRVVLLFRPAEETGEGGPAVVMDPIYQKIRPDYVFAYHNLPGFPLGHILLREGSMTTAASGIVVKLYGRTSHAAHPENGISPALAMSRIMEDIHALPGTSDYNSDRNLCIIGYSILGEKTLGTSPGYGEIGIVGRSETNERLLNLFEQCRDIVERHAKNHQLKHSVEWQDKFQATINNPDAVNWVRQIAVKYDYPVIELDQGLRFADDIGELISRSVGALFCLGSGEDSPQLHNPDYDFPDSLINIAGNLFYGVADKIQNS
ncbi:MAG: amidohydrolase [Desulfotignum sp.]|nr:amidohydrolase [Desulfotignum sp.]